MKIFRSSEKLMRLHMKSNETNVPETKRPVPETYASVSSFKSVESVQEPEWQQVGSRRLKLEKQKPTGRTYMVVARGFHWKVTKREVIDFFNGIKVVNGENGVTIVKNVAMEAHVVLGSKGDRKKALALHNKQYDSRTITGKISLINLTSKCRLILFLLIVTEMDPKVSASTTKSMTSSKIIQIRGLPWSVDKDYVFKLFPGEVRD